MTDINGRYDFVYIFDVTNGNPNGDPDAGNLPRMDPETNCGLVTDVSLKRKVRNFVEIFGGEGNRIYVKERTYLTDHQKEAYRALDIEVDEKASKVLPKDRDKAAQLTEWMCRNFYDIRTFGAVMTTSYNTGQVRGPVQLTFATSVDPILPMEISITRMAATKEEPGKNDIRTMGRKHIVPYGLYRCHGFVSAHLADKTGFSEADLKLFWEALQTMFDHDRSAARGEMTARELVVFKHDSKIGNAPAHKLFKRVTVERAPQPDLAEGEAQKPPRAFEDYIVDVDTADLPAGISVERMI